MGLNCRPGRLYVDGTVGEGGHAAAILDCNPPGRAAVGFGSRPRGPRDGRRPAGAPHLQISTVSLLLQPFGGACWRKPIWKEWPEFFWIWGCLPSNCRLRSGASPLWETSPWICGSTPKMAGTTAAPVAQPRPPGHFGKDFLGVWGGAPGPAPGPPGGSGPAAAPFPHHAATDGSH